MAKNPQPEVPFKFTNTGIMKPCSLCQQPTPHVLALQLEHPQQWGLDPSPDGKPRVVITECCLEHNVTKPKTKKLLTAYFKANKDQSLKMASVSPAGQTGE